jgi:hypothetical protein
MAKALNPKGTTGNVGEMFSNYVQSVETQKAMEAEMKKKELWTSLMTKWLMGQSGPQGMQRPSGGPNPDMTSQSWLLGAGLARR